MAEIKQLIKKLCENIEKEKKVKILFAIESGSRVWRLHSTDSDYDVRFVYVRPLEEYIQINKPAEVIERFFDREGKSCNQTGCFIDMVGFDIFKYTRMLSSSNPTSIEWLFSDIVYHGKQPPVFRRFVQKSFQKISLYFHYKSMCRQNYLKYLKSGNEVTYKKYLYAMRGLINAKYVVEFRKIPPIKFPDTIKTITTIPAKIKKKLLKMIELKKQGREKQIIQNIPQIDTYIENFLKDDTEAPTKKQLVTYTELNKELRRIIIKK